MKKLATYDTIKKIVKYMKSNFIRTSDPIFRQPSTAYAVGDIVYVKGVGVKYYLLCVTAGTTAETDIDMTGVADGSSIADGAVVWKVRKTGSADGMPIGGILPFAGNDAVPTGYLLCDGAAVSRTMYPDLFSVIGTTYGAGDGSTTFNVPDYNTAKRFAQGDTVAGTVKQPGLPNITGSLVFEQDAMSSTGNEGCIWYSSGSQHPGAIHYKYNLDGNGGFVKVDASKSNPIYGASDTVQPPALTCRYIIKYK